MTRPQLGQGGATPNLEQFQQELAALREQLAQAVRIEEITALNTRGRGRRWCANLSTLRKEVDAILTCYRVHGPLHVRYMECFCERLLLRDGRREWEGQVTVSVDQEAVVTAVRQVGWQVYVTTQLLEELSLQEAVLAYRSEYLVDRPLGRLKGCPLSLTPMYLERDNQTTGLIHLLSFGLRVLTLLEFGMRQRLAKAMTPLAGLYLGNPKRATAHPTAERLLEPFRGLTLTFIRERRRQRYHLTPLSRVQRCIVALLDFPDSHNSSSK